MYLLHRPFCISLSLSRVCQSDFALVGVGSAAGASQEVPTAASQSVSQSLRKFLAISSAIQKMLAIAVAMLWCTHVWKRWSDRTSGRIQNTVAGVWHGTAMLQLWLSLI